MKSRPDHALDDGRLSTDSIEQLALQDFDKERNQFEEGDASDSSAAAIVSRVRMADTRRYVVI